MSRKLNYREIEATDGRCINKNGNFVFPFNMSQELPKVVRDIGRSTTCKTSGISRSKRWLILIAEALESVAAPSHVILRTKSKGPANAVDKAFRIHRYALSPNYAEIQRLRAAAETHYVEVSQHNKKRKST